jgi:hypothetical protein
VNNHTSITSSHFDPKLNTKFIVHGFIDDLIVGGWMKHIKDEFLKKGKYNIIIVDWSSGNEPPYGQATVNTRVVGAVTANLIKDLNVRLYNKTVLIQEINHKYFKEFCILEKYIQYLIFNGEST